MFKAMIAAVSLLTGVAVADDTAQVDVPTPYNTGTSHYVAILPGYQLVDKDRGATRRGFTLSGIYGYQFWPHWSAELNLFGSTLETGHDRGTDFYQEGGTVDLVYGFTNRSVDAVTPFVLLGVGGVYNDVVPNSGDKASFIANAGLGLVTKPLIWGAKLRVDARYVFDTYDGGTSDRPKQDARFLAGIEIPFGVRTVKTEKVVETVKVVEVVKPEPFIDSDGDGVEDKRDKCPDTPKGLKVDADGCVIVGQILELRGVTFEFNKATLQLNAQTVLDYVVKGMKGQPTMEVEIAGHTDTVGSAAYNLKLSQKRAEAVREYLVGHGVESARLTARGYGKTQLKVSPETSALDREVNRRVEFRVTGR